MTRETPDPTPTEGGDTTGEGARAKWLAVVGAIMVITIAGGISVSLLTSHGSAPKSEKVPAARGLACPSLQQAADAFARGDLQTYNEAIDNAARVAQDTLQISGQAFGEPERIALELGLGDVHDPTRLLDRSRALCAMLG